MRSRAAYAVIRESLSGDHTWIIQVPVITHEGVFQFLGNSAEIKVCEILPSAKMSKASEL
jgi:hypothetical protein